jgi:iron complex outermembrane receptor protein
LHTLDIELQQNFISGVQRIIWGAGARANRFRITNSSVLTFDPSDRTLTLGNLFLQDTIRLADPLDLTIGLKGEHDSYSGWNLLPDIRLSWRIGESAMSWIGASRAVRSPTPFEVDVIEKAPDGTVVLVGNPDFQPEAVNAFEMGLRVQPAASFSLSASMFYDDYDDLRTIETNPATGFLPLSWGNRMDGYTYGAEAWAKWQVTSGWRLAPGVRWVEKHLKFDAGASGLGGLNQSGNDPKYQVLLTSSADLRANLTLDATLRYVDELPEPALDSYYELSASLAWHATSNLNLSVSGQNLLNHRHIEYPATSGEYIRRGIFALARWTF